MLDSTGKKDAEQPGPPDPGQPKSHGVRSTQGGIDKVCVLTRDLQVLISAEKAKR